MMIAVIPNNRNPHAIRKKNPPHIHCIPFGSSPDNVKYEDREKLIIVCNATNVGTDMIKIDAQNAESSCISIVLTNSEPPNVCRTIF